PTALLTRSLSVRRSGCPLGSHAWILIAMFHLAMDLASCQPPATGTGGRLSPRPALRHRLSRGSLWGTGSGEELQRPGPPWTCAPAPPLQRPRSRRPPPAAPPPAVTPRCVPPSGRHAVTPPCVPPSRRHAPRRHAVTPPCIPPPCVTTSRAATSCRHAPSPRPLYRVAPARDPPHPGRTSTAEPAAGHSSGGKDARPPRGLGDSTGLAVHQIITITVSLIMVIAALITTLVLKNCCAQSGRPRRNSHQRKLDQQEESCQNLTDFAPARVPSALDIFTAYNETLQCSHECVRTPVPVYAEDTLHSPGDYKTTFNGNRPSSSDRHLIPVAFVSEKWFEISC
ncbi:AJAP1 protein, partial [Ptilorrhoa leucosticta]|nr:AJAP1 protein [Ptilorrhoa leucosticta]